MDGMGRDGMDLRVGGGIEHLTVLIIRFIAHRVHDGYTLEEDDRQVHT